MGDESDDDEVDTEYDFEKEWTEAEAAILREVAERKGDDWVRNHSEHILNQARLVGEIE